MSKLEPTSRSKTLESRAIQLQYGSRPIKPEDALIFAFVLLMCDLCVSEGESEKSAHFVNGNRENNILSRPERSSDSDAVLITYGLIKSAVTVPGAAAYLGCFSTADQWSAETAHLTAARGRLSGRDVRNCVEECWGQRARLAMLGRGSNCLCGGLLTMMTKDDSAPSLCQAPCVNNASESCGGTTALDVYYTGYIEEPSFDVIAYDEIKKVFKGCYEDPQYKVLCNFSFSTSRLNVEMCMEYCSSNFFKYAAIDRCCCSMTLKDAYATKPGKCDLLCKDGRGKHESCGGDGGFLAVYVTGATEVLNWKPKVPDHPWMRPRIDDAIIPKLIKVNKERPKHLEQAEEPKK